MDILGTCGKWQSERAQSYLGSWQSLNFVMDAIIQDMNSYENISCNEITITKQAEYEIDISTFSDTIIVTLSLTDEQNVVTGLSLIGRIIMQLFFWGLHGKLLFRGVFSIDKFYALKDSSRVFAGIPISESFTPTKKFLFIGPAVDEAAKWYDKSDWIGISTTHSATARLDELIENVELNKYFVKLDTTKYGVKLRGWALAWPRYDEPPSLNPTNNSYLPYLEQQKKLYQDLQSEKRIFSKYDNTINFYNDVRQRN